MKPELISLSDALKLITSQGAGKDEVLIEITSNIRSKKLKAFLNKSGIGMVEEIEKRGGGIYFITGTTSYNIEGFMLPGEVPLLEVAHSIHFIEQQIFDMFGVQLDTTGGLNDLKSAKAGKATIPVPKAYYKKAIREAISVLGKGATNEQIYQKIKSLRAGAKDSSYLYEIEFEGDEVFNFNVTSQTATVLMSGGRAISKQTFQDSVSKLKK
ncbi:hypothetical protein [Thiomicrorhabdus sp. Kp2]|uniref:hypothetical protein n=1 Tax=Thiomicrorhabdus sp. Kp2 TaxID=1123518 RepID=UPI000416DE2E|nr:hypothetical protein [Thiomicrorhabdus sp. Kp2]